MSEHKALSRQNESSAPLSPPPPSSSSHPPSPSSSSSVANADTSLHEVTHNASHTLVSLPTARHNERCSTSAPPLLHLCDRNEAEETASCASSRRASLPSASLLPVVSTSPQQTIATVTPTTTNAELGATKETVPPTILLTRSPPCNGGGGGGSSDVHDRERVGRGPSPSLASAVPATATTACSSSSSSPDRGRTRPASSSTGTLAPCLFQQHTSRGHSPSSSSSLLTSTGHAGLVPELFDNNKAGLQSVDKAKVDAVIQAASEGSPYYANEQRKRENRERKVLELREKARVYETNVASNPVLLEGVRRKVAALEQELEASRRRLDRVFVHMDMDMFYAAVEQKKRPELEKLPLGVGSNMMLSTTNYVARQYGVRAGMAGFIGRKLCPELIIVPLDFAAYKAEAAVVREIAKLYDPHFSSAGWDELSMDLTDYITTHYPEAQSMTERFTAAGVVVEECRRKVFEATQLTASAGIAPTALFAKIASNYKKPNGQHTLALVTREAVLEFMWGLPVRHVPGIGKSMEHILTGLGMNKVGDIYEHRHLLSYLFTPKTFHFLLTTSLGLSAWYSYEGDHVQGTEENPFDVSCQSIGQERTFTNLKSRTELQTIAHENLTTSYNRMKRKALMCGQVVVKMKHRSFHVKQHSKAAPDYTDDPDVLRRVLDEIMLPLLDDYADYRLCGVRLEKMITKAEYEFQQSQKPQCARKQSSLTALFARQQQQQQQLKQKPCTNARPGEGVGHRKRTRPNEAVPSSLSLSHSMDEDGVIVVTSTNELDSDEDRNEAIEVFSLHSSSSSSLSSSLSSSPPPPPDGEASDEERKEEQKEGHSVTRAVPRDGGVIASIVPPTVALKQPAEGKQHEHSTGHVRGAYDVPSLLLQRKQRSPPQKEAKLSAAEATTRLAEREATVVGLPCALQPLETKTTEMKMTDSAGSDDEEAHDGEVVIID